MQDFEISRRDLLIVGAASLATPSFATSVAPVSAMTPAGAVGSH
jgi:hypothetical protein